MEHAINEKQDIDKYANAYEVLHDISNFVTRVLTANKDSCFVILYNLRLSLLQSTLDTGVFRLADG